MSLNKFYNEMHFHDPHLNTEVICLSHLTL